MSSISINQRSSTTQEAQARVELPSRRVHVVLVFDVAQLVVELFVCVDAAVALLSVAGRVRQGVLVSTRCRAARANLDQPAPCTPTQIRREAQVKSDAPQKHFFVPLQKNRNILDVVFKIQ